MPLLHSVLTRCCSTGLFSSALPAAHPLHSDQVSRYASPLLYFTLLYAPLTHPLHADQVSRYTSPLPSNTPLRTFNLSFNYTPTDQVYLALALVGTGTKASPGPSPGLLSVATAAWEKNTSLGQAASPGRDALPGPGLALVRDPLGLGLPPGGLVLDRVQGSAAGAGLARVLLRLFDRAGPLPQSNRTAPSQTSQSNRTAPSQTSQSNRGSGLQRSQRLLVLAALESYVAVSAHPCPQLTLQVGSLLYRPLCPYFCRFSYHTLVLIHISLTHLSTLCTANCRSQVRRQYQLAQSNRTAPSPTPQSNGFDLHCARALTAWRSAKKERARAKEKENEKDIFTTGGDSYGDTSGVPSAPEKRGGGGFGLGFGGLGSSGSGSSNASTGSAFGGGGGFNFASKPKASGPAPDTTTSTTSGQFDSGLLADNDSSGSASSSSGSAFGRGGFNFASKPKTPTAPDTTTNTTATTSGQFDTGLRVDNDSGSSGRSGVSAFGGGGGFNFASKPKTTAPSPDPNTFTTGLLDTGLLADSDSGSSCGSAFKGGGGFNFSSKPKTTASIVTGQLDTGLLADSDSGLLGQVAPPPPDPPKPQPAPKPAVRNMLDMY